MPDPTPTTIFGWVVPQVDGDNNAWGTELNDFFRQVDTDVGAVKTTADAGAASISALLAACKILPNANQSISEDTDTQVSFAGPTEEYNDGSFVTSTSGIKCPVGFTGVMEMVAQVGLSTLGDPSSDAAAKIKVWIEKSGGGTVGESWAQLDSQNSSTQGHRIQVVAHVHNPNSVDTYVVKVRTPAGVGTVTLLAANTWFAAKK